MSNPNKENVVENFVTCNHLTSSSDEGLNVVYKQTTDFEERRIGRARICARCYAESKDLGMLIHSEAEAAAWLAGKSD